MKPRNDFFNIAETWKPAKPRIRIYYRSIDEVVEFYVHTRDTVLLRVVPAIVVWQPNARKLIVEAAPFDFSEGVISPTSKAQNE